MLFLAPKKIMGSLELIEQHEMASQVAAKSITMTLVFQRCANKDYTKEARQTGFLQSLVDRGSVIAESSIIVKQ